MSDLGIENMSDDDILRLSKALLSGEDEVSPFWKYFQNYDEAEKIAEQLYSERDYTGEDEKKKLKEEEIVTIVKQKVKEKAEEFNIDLPDFDTPQKPILNTHDIHEYEEQQELFEHDLSHFADFIELAFIDCGGKVIYSETE